MFLCFFIRSSTRSSSTAEICPLLLISCEICWEIEAKNSSVKPNSEKMQMLGRQAGGTPLCGLNGNVRANRVWFQRFCLEWDINLSLSFLNRASLHGLTSSQDTHKHFNLKKPHLRIDFVFIFVRTVNANSSVIHKAVNRFVVKLLLFCS